jgi:hypothetical protein
MHQITIDPVFEQTLANVAGQVVLCDLKAGQLVFFLRFLIGKTSVICNSNRHCQLRKPKNYGKKTVPESRWEKSSDG